MMPPAAAQVKTYIPRVKPVPGTVGQYTVNSERWIYIEYLVDVQAGTCECEGNAKWGKRCKHIIASMAVHQAMASRKAALVAHYRGAEALMELYA